MEEDRMPKKIFTQELEGTRQRGRPRKGWREEVKRDLQMLGVRRWRELVIDGEVLFDRPKPTAGCSANGRRKSFRLPYIFYLFMLPFTILCICETKKLFNSSLLGTSTTKFSISPLCPLFSNTL
jgi:hypothetical protein